MVQKTIRWRPIDRRHVRNASIGLAAAVLLAACGGSNSPSTPASQSSGDGSGTSTVSIGGTISALTTSGLILQNNGTDDISIGSGETTFTFDTPLLSGSTYAVTFSSYPAGLYCSLSNQSGTAGTDITGIAVACSAWTSATAETRLLAGNSAGGSNNGTAAAASFQSPFGVASDAKGNVYVADRGNNLIRKISPLGVVTTLAGSGSVGHADGTGTAASFSSPDGVAVDDSGNVYVADTGNDEIRMITAAGVVTTLAGSTTQGFTDGTGSAAAFYAPFSVAVDTDGTVYVADQGNSAIRAVTAAGVVTTLAGGTSGYLDGTGTAAKFNNPSGVAVDSSGNVYVADQLNNRIRMITPAGVVTTFAGSGTATFADGTGTAASFSAPIGIAVDSADNVYIGDNANNRIRMISPAGVVRTLAGSGTSGATNGAALSSTFNQPFGVAIDRGNVVVADRSNNEIRIVVRTQ